jgi:deoxyribose-phosphate aldolase
MALNKAALAKMIDHTLLKTASTREEVMRFCDEGKRFGFATVVVNPTYVSLASRLMKGTVVKVGTVVGFPLGANTPEVKAYEASNCLMNGAEELDMVMNIGALKSGNLDLVKRDIGGVVRVAKARHALSKVIIEACYLSREEKVNACLVVLESGADFVKTSTGFGAQGATVEDVKLLKELVADKIGVKASGGIRTYRDALSMIEAGATRVGASSGMQIIAEAPE